MVQGDNHLDKQSLRLHKSGGVTVHTKKNTLSRQFALHLSRTVVTLIHYRVTNIASLVAFITDWRLFLEGR